MLFRTQRGTCNLICFKETFINMSNDINETECDVNMNTVNQKVGHIKHGSLSNKLDKII